MPLIASDCLWQVLKPYSVLYVAINDYDNAAKHEMVSSAQLAKGDECGDERSTRMTFDGDDPIGRVALPLGNLVAHTE